MRLRLEMERVFAYFRGFIEIIEVRESQIGMREAKFVHFRGVSENWRFEYLEKLCGGRFLI